MEGQTSEKAETEPSRNLEFIPWKEIAITPRVQIIEEEPVHYIKVSYTGVDNNGPSDTAQKPKITICAFPSFGGGPGNNLETFRAINPEIFKNMDITMLAFFNPGHGQTSANFDLSRFAEAVRHVPEMQEENAHIAFMGSSMGGLIAMECTLQAAENGEKVDLFLDGPLHEPIFGYAALAWTVAKVGIDFIIPFLKGFKNREKLAAIMGTPPKDVVQKIGFGLRFKDVANLTNFFSFSPGISEKIANLSKSGKDIKAGLIQLVYGSLDFVTSATDQEFHTSLQSFAEKAGGTYEQEVLDKQFHAHGVENPELFYSQYRDFMEDVISNTKVSDSNS